MRKTSFWPLSQPFFKVNTLSADALAIESRCSQMRALASPNLFVVGVTSPLHSKYPKTGIYGEWMAYQPDLAQTGLFNSVGYLSRDHDYPKGETSDLVFDRLAIFAMRPLYSYAGHHHCDLGSCGSDPPHQELKWRGMTIPRWCSTDILVPDRTLVYIAPALILHYICAHRYLPPACFIDAVLTCPEPESDEYRSEIRRIVPNIPFC